MVRAGSKIAGAPVRVITDNVNLVADPQYQVAGIFGTRICVFTDRVPGRRTLDAPFGYDIAAFAGHCVTRVRSAAVLVITQVFFQQAVAVKRVALAKQALVGQVIGANLFIEHASAVRRVTVVVSAVIEVVTDFQSVDALAVAGVA
jgi:hypothetical protein